MIRPRGGSAPVGLAPGERVSVETMLDSQRGATTIAMVGRRWRMRAAPWPDDTGPECLLWERFTGQEWKPVRVLNPDGTEAVIP